MNSAGQTLTIKETKTKEKKNKKKWLHWEVPVTTCNESCGCPTPCPGGVSCRIQTEVIGNEHDPMPNPKRCANRTDPPTASDHKKCSCGAHCGCNPCTCASKVVTNAVGKAYCKCGANCNCASCSA